MRRRRAIKMTGASIGVLAAIASNTTAPLTTDPSTRFRNDIIQALEEAEKKQARAGEALRNKGYRVNSKNIGVSRPTVGNKNIGTETNFNSTEDPNDGGIEFIFSVIKDYNSDIYTFTLEINYNFKFKTYRSTTNCSTIDINTGVSPRDGAGLFYNNQNNHWRLATNNYDADIIARNNAEFVEGESDPGSGVLGFRLDDKKTYETWRDSVDYSCSNEYTANRYGGTIGVMLKPQGSFSKDERSVYAHYTHAHYVWRGIGSSISLGDPSSMSVSIDSTGGNISQTQISSDEDGNVLVLYEEDVPEEDPCVGVCPVDNGS